VQHSSFAFWEEYPMEHELKELINKCDSAIKREDFDTLMNYYTDDAILVVKPGMIREGKKKSKKHLLQLQNTSITASYPHRGKCLFLEVQSITHMVQT
jgi:ketosteroid isomerase-like protein